MYKLELFTRFRYVLTCSTHVLSALEVNINMSYVLATIDAKALSLAADSCRFTISGAFALHKFIG
jgi:hypothetical protein